MKFRELREKIEGTEMSPAPMLVLRRRGIRIFPDGRKVALYTNDKYNLVFTIPYGGSQEEISPIVGGTNV